MILRSGILAITLQGEYVFPLWFAKSGLFGQDKGIKRKKKGHELRAINNTVI